MRPRMSDIKQVRLPQFHDQAESVRGQFLQALPVIVYFLVMFYTVILLYGTQYTMVVSLGTLVFQSNYKKKHSVRSLVLLVLQQMFLAALAYIATWNLALTLILNLTVPFWLIFSKASQFNQLGYFSTLMPFTFLQLIPLSWEEFLVQYQAMGLCCAMVFAAILIYPKLVRKKSGICTERQVMQLLGCILEKSLNHEELEDDLKELFRLQRLLYQEAAQKRGKTHIVTTKGKLQYMFASLIQRTTYLVSTQSHVLLPAAEEDRQLALMMAEYMKEAGTVDFLSGDRDATMHLETRGRELLHMAEKRRDIFHRHVTTFFRMFLFILHQADIQEEGLLSEQWEVPAGHRFRERLLARFRPDTFEMRFALRMSIVLMTGMVFNQLFPEGHSYWFVMNAFLLLRPMYEDSNYRMRTRFIGTAAGCLILSLILPFCESTGSHLLLAGIMVVCMYTATPGTITHALFVTCFALTMTTLAIQETTAMLLRMAYVAASVLFVLVVNRFFFPTSMGSQFRYNFQMLFHMHHMYLRILEDSLTHPMDYWRICDAQIQYHLVHAQIRKDLPGAEKDEKDRAYFLKILEVAWCMASEVQQMFFLVKHKKRGADERRIMERYIWYTDYVLNQIQEMLHLKKEKKLKNIAGMKYQRFIPGEPELSSLMTQYARNLSRLYVLVLRRVR
ncbi:MAG TPA: FUSC family protein [Candidatus Mediterraneibacter merdipullorum]|nr:FUSC family protein [Candidatus Mediterraneibacter merdipullorum]